MRMRSGRIPWTFAAGLLCVLTTMGVVHAAGSVPPPPPAPSSATCVFSNPAYSGKCTQTSPIAAGSNEQKTCESILQCLNDTRCLKTYCGTEIRMGWKLESAKITTPAR
jgi:hypothetical protein